jgi:hypothetical protein
MRKFYRIAIQLINAVVVPAPSYAKSVNPKVDTESTTAQAGLPSITVAIIDGLFRPGNAVSKVMLALFTTF